MLLCNLIGYLGDALYGNTIDLYIDLGKYCPVKNVKTVNNDRGQLKNYSEKNEKFLLYTVHNEYDISKFVTDVLHGENQQPKKPSLRRETTGSMKREWTMSEQKREAWRSGRPFSKRNNSNNNSNSNSNSSNTENLTFDNNETDFKRTLSCPPVPRPKHERRYAMSRYQMHGMKDKLKKNQCKMRQESIPEVVVETAAPREPDEGEQGTYPPPESVTRRIVSILCVYSAQKTI